MGNVDRQHEASDLNRRSILDYYKPKTSRLNSDEGGREASDLTARNLPPDDRPRARNAPAVDLHKLEEELGRRRLDEIADVLRALTYGEMMELAASMWNVKPDGSSLTEDNLPAVLHRWSTLRQS